MFDFSCPFCKREYHADESQVGKHIRCLNPDCANIVTINRSEIFHTISGQFACSVTPATAKDTFRRWKNQVFIKGERKIKSAFAIAACLTCLGLIFSLGYIARGHQHNPLTLKDTEDHPRIDIQPGLVPGSQATQASSAAITPQSVQLSDGDYEWLPIVPVAKKERPVHVYHVDNSQSADAKPANSLPTGTAITPDRAVGGHGKLEAINGTSFDACVIVVNADTAQRVRKRYVRAQDSFTLGQLEPGNYKVVFATGIDWNDGAERFNRSASYFEFGKVLNFQEIVDYRGIEYDHLSITLNPVLNGNVRSRSLSEAEFHARSGSR